ncbi:MAG: hypothetical protein H6807_09790 [Planctomycetes bacterium]|nr:hypothetical protein [Planctomycetota bacterium]
MLRPWHWTFSLMSVLLPGLILLGGVDDRGGPRRETFAPAKLEVFPHDRHVSSRWMRRGTAEEARDCRGCHDYDPADGIVAVSDTCVRCHYDFPDGRKSLVVQGQYDDRDDPDATFQHFDHLNLDCRDCHQPPGDLPPAVPRGMYMPDGIGLCVRCHDPKSGKAEPNAVAAKGQAGFQKKINAAPRMQRNADAVFLHSQHLAPGDLNDPARCATCHKSMVRAAADLRTELFETAACGDCHQDQAGQALPFGFGAGPRNFVSLSDRSFHHADHLTPEALKKSKALGDRSCLACHQELKEEGRGVSDYPLRWRPEQVYEACATCHQEAGLTREGRPVAWKVTDHGDVADKNDCGACHLLGVAAPLKTARAMRESGRSHPVVFDLKMQKHPHIIGAGKKPDDCAGCHISRMEIAPSRIVRRAFDHASHLAAEPSLTACLDCHKLETGRKGQFMERAGAGGRTLSYDEGLCASCHLGVEKVAPSQWRETEERILRFDHADHVRPGDPKGLDCGKCHVPAERDGGDFAYREGTTDCSACHDHGKHPETTGKKDRAYVDGCAACHEKHEPGLPPVDVDLSCSRLDLTSIDAAQHHPLPRDQACSKCHLPATTTDTMHERSSQLLQSARNGYDEAAKFHKIAEDGGFATPGYCWSCHFHNPGNAGKDATQAVIGGKVVPIGNQGYANHNRVDQIRAALGKELKGYPGLQK